MLNSVIPIPTSSVSSTGSAAISPHTETRMLRRRPARATTRRTRRIAGWSGSYNRETRSSVRSTARQVLDQIVGADGEEVRFGSQQVCGQRGLSHGIPGCGRGGPARPGIPQPARRQRSSPPGLRRPGQRIRRRLGRRSGHGGGDRRAGGVGGAVRRRAPRHARHDDGRRRPPGRGRRPAGHDGAGARTRRRHPRLRTRPGRRGAGPGAGRRPGAGWRVRGRLGGRRGPRRHQRRRRSVGELPRIRPHGLVRRHQPGEPRRTAQPSRRDAAGLAGHQRDDAARVDLQGRLDHGRGGDGRGPQRPVRLHVDVPGGRPRLRELRVTRLRGAHAPAQPRGLLRHDLVPLRLPVLARAGRAGREGRRERPVRHGGQGVRARAPTGVDLPGEVAGAYRTGCGSGRPGRRRSPRPAPGRPPGTPRSGPPTPCAPTTSRRWPSRTAPPGGSTARVRGEPLDRPGRRGGHAAPAGPRVRRGGQRRDAVGSAGGGGDPEPGRVGRTPIAPVASGTFR